MSTEIITLIESFNFDMYDAIGDEEPQLQLRYWSNGYYEVVEFLGVQIWSSEDDEREWDEETQDYEPLKEFLKERMRQVSKIVIKWAELLGE